MIIRFRVLQDLQAYVIFKKYLPVFLLLFCFSTGNAFGQSTAIALTADERAYIQQLGPVTMCVDPDWKPYESISEKGEHVGIAADLLKIISDRTGIILQLIPTVDWNESLLRSRSGECMILSFLNQTSDREEWLVFTDPYLTDYNVFITREEHDYIPDPGSLVGKSIALPYGTSVEERIRRDYPNLHIILVDNEEEAIQAVNDREADMTLRSLTVSAYVIRKEGLFNLKIAGQLPDYANQLCIGVAKDHPLLRDIFNKAIATLTAEEKQHAVNNHVSIEMFTGTDYVLVVRILMVSLLVLIMGLLWNYQLRKLNTRLAVSQKELLQTSEQLKLDIRARELVEAELRNREQQLSSLITNLPGFVYHCLNDEHYTMEFISAGCQAITGYCSEDFLHNSKISFAKIILPEYLERIKQKWDAALEHDEHFEHEYQIQHANGQHRWVWEKGHGVLASEGKFQRLEGFITDITDRKQAEESLKESERRLRELNATKDKFFSIIAHDLKSPFNSILGFSELLVEQIKEKDYDGVERYAEIIRQSSNRAMDLLMNLMEWSRTQSHRNDFNPEYFELVDLINTTCQMFEDVARQKTISLQLDLPRNAPVFADKAMIGSVLRNLISNAVKFTKPGGHIKISALKHPGELMVSVKDTGIGISADCIAKLFRIDESYSTPGTNKEMGTGLGLVLCKEFVEKHGGNIWVESLMGKGSSFSFSIPMID